MLVQILVALAGEAIFGAINARHRGFRAEMERYLEDAPGPEPDQSRRRPAR